MEPLGTSPAEFKAFVDAEMRRWTPVVQAAKIKPTGMRLAASWQRSSQRRFEDCSRFPYDLSRGASERMRSAYFTSFTPVTFSRFL